MTLTKLPAEIIDSSPPDSTTPPGSQPPSRRATILSLVEMLLQESDGQGLNIPQSCFEDDRDVPSVDEHHQVAGAEAFHKFERSINNLDKELRNFANAARQLGSSVAILSSAFHLRERLAQILFLYQQNAADLFPQKIAHIPRESLTEFHTPERRQRGGRRRRGKAPSHVPRPVVTELLDPECFPEQLEALASEVTTFLHTLNEFPEFTDEAVNASILTFEGDLKYWSSCLKEYAGQFRYPAVQRYIHDLTDEMGEHIDGITSSLCMFVEVGVPTIRFAQKHDADNLLNLSTVATFFSAVTATTLQFSYQLDHDALSEAVNSMWFGSLVFSIAAAVNSLLGLTWKQAIYRSPGDRVPWWVLIWIKRSPLVFLVLSVACFSIGLCCFAYASHQSFVTSTLTTVLTAFTSFGLAAVSAWFASERWTFAQHRGQKWLSDVLVESIEQILQTPAISWTGTVVNFLRRNVEKTRAAVLSFYEWLRNFCSSSQESDDEGCDLEANNVPTISGGGRSRPPSHLEPSGPNKHGTTGVTLSVLTEPPKPAHVVPPVALAVPPRDQESTEPEAPTPISPGKQLWQKAFQNVKLRNTLAALSSASGNPSQPYRRRTTSFGLPGSGPYDRKKGTLEPVTVLKSRISTLVPSLTALEATQDLAAHNALVRHLEFSPDGRFLATSSWDKTSIIFRVGDPFISHRTLAHREGFVGQVAWSPTGNLLLTKMARGIKIWTEDGVCTKTMYRDAAVETVSWFPGGEAFLSVEESIVTKLDVNGKVLDRYDFGRMKIHDVAITPDSLRVLAVGPLLESPTGLHPSKSRVEKRLVVYNMETKLIENQTPVLNDVRDITIGQTPRSGLIVLISYENKAPPQLWRLELVKDRGNNSITARLTLRHTYMPKIPIDFSGRSYFGGKNNELVLCAGKAGDIHIWDQESGALLHLIRAQAHTGDLTCIAWNHAADNPFMFATGSHDGGVRIWTKIPEEPPFTDTPFELDTNSEFRDQSLYKFPRSASPLPQDDTYGESFDTATPASPPEATGRFSSALKEKEYKFFLAMPPTKHKPPL